MLVCGLGQSLGSLVDLPCCPSIGVNDIGRALDPTYLICMDPLDVFPADRRRFIEHSTSQFIFSHADTGITGDNVVSCPLALSERPRVADEGGFYHPGAPLTSIYLALELAAFMGADPIGLIGVDFCGGYFFDPEHSHNLNSYAVALNRMFLELGHELKNIGVRVLNLSDRSSLTAFPRMSLDDLLRIPRS
ncbi:MAG: hypothetical protein M3O41_03790 [Pseudomonadota bacterium]|nr:hypothetical protein [Pseudomonadota bacterium]